MNFMYSLIQNPVFCKRGSRWRGSGGLSNLWILWRRCGLACIKLALGTREVTALRVSAIEELCDIGSNSTLQWWFSSPVYSHCCKRLWGKQEMEMRSDWDLCTWKQEGFVSVIRQVLVAHQGSAYVLVPMARILVSGVTPAAPRQHLVWNPLSPWSASKSKALPCAPSPWVHEGWLGKGLGCVRELPTAVSLIPYSSKGCHLPYKTPVWGADETGQRSHSGMSSACGHMLICVWCSPLQPDGCIGGPRPFEASLSRAAGPPSPAWQEWMGCVRRDQL